MIIDLCDAFYGTMPRIERLTRLREGRSDLRLSVSFGNSWDNHSGLPARLVWSIKQISIDGESVNVHNAQHQGRNWNGYYAANFEAGDHELAIEVDCAYVDGDKMTNLRSGAIDAYRWPKQTRKKWKQTVSTQFKVFAAKDTIVSLSTDPQDDPVPPARSASSGLLYCRTTTRRARYC